MLYVCMYVGNHDSFLLHAQKPRDASAPGTDSKLILFPAQIRKISGLIGLLTQQRDLCLRLREAIMKEGNTESVSTVASRCCELFRLYLRKSRFRRSVRGNQTVRSVYRSAKLTRLS